jgi:hypothetical protein
MQGLKLVFLSLLLLYNIFKPVIRLSFIRNSIIYASLFFIPLIVGLVNNNKIEYIISSLRINLIFPLLFFFVLQKFDTYDIEKIVKKAAFVSIILITIITLSTLFFALNLFPFNINTFFYAEETNIGLNEGYVHIINSSLSYLIFIIPLVYFDKAILNVKNLKFYVFAISFIVSFISGRRILLLPYILVILLNFKKFIILFVLFSSVLFIFRDSTFVASMDVDIIINRFEDAINSEGDSSVRKEQALMFEKHIKTEPFLGAGLGSFMEDYKRNDVFETAYEKTYHYMFFSLGIPIAFLTLSYYFYLIFKVYLNKSIGDFKFALIVAVISLLLASNTNPYWLNNFDYTFPMALLMRFSQNSKLKIF